MEAVGFRVQPIEPAVVRADPQDTVFIFIESPDALGAETAGVVRVVPVVAEEPCLPIESAQSVLDGSDPEPSRAVFEESVDRAVDQALGVLGAGSLV